MCDDCTESAYAWGEAALEVAGQEIDILTEALEEIADLHRYVRVLNAPVCESCDAWWPCVTFLTAVGALNDVR